MRQVTTLICFSLLATMICEPALAEPVRTGRPRDPTAVSQASRWLDFYWRDCREKAYPKDVERGTAKLSSTVVFKRAGNHLRAVLTIALIDKEGKKQKPNRDQTSFARCVKRRLEARRFFASADASVGVPVALPNPAFGCRVLNGRELGVCAAKRYAVRSTGRALRLCRVPIKRPRVTVSIEVNADGSVGAVTVQGLTQRHNRCVQRQMKSRLRFPATAKASQVEVSSL
jgi:hypothetical protein